MVLFKTSPIQLFAWVYAILFLTVVSLGYIPGFTDGSGMLFGLFHIDIRDDVLHSLSGLWAAYAAWKSPQAAKFYFRAFGIFYTSDAFFGFFTGYAFVDIITGAWGANAGYAMSNMSHNFAANFPHFIIGPLAILASFLIRSFMSVSYTTGNLFYVSFITYFLTPVLNYNILLAIFNLLPIPPLDGSKIFALLLPEKEANAYLSLSSIGTFILLFLLLFPLGGFSLSNFVFNLYSLARGILLP